MYRQYARSKRGKRVNIRISGKRHARIGLVAAQRESALLAPHTYSGTMKASLFEKWFEDKLLNCLPKGHVIIMDNAAFHKKKGFAESCGEILAGTDFFCRRIHLNIILLNTHGEFWSEKLLAAFIYMPPFHRLWMPF